MSRSIKTEQIDVEEQLLVRLAYACEIEGLTQAEAAERFGLTRLEGEQGPEATSPPNAGICGVSIDSILCGQRRNWNWRVADRFRPDARGGGAKPGKKKKKTPPFPPPSLGSRRWSVPGWGGILGGLLQDPRDAPLSANVVGQYTQPCDAAHAVRSTGPIWRIVSVMGGILRGSDVNGYEITTRLADLCNAQHSFFVAPVYAGSAASRRMFMEQDVIVEGLEKLRGCDAGGVGGGRSEQFAAGPRCAAARMSTSPNWWRWGAVGDHHRPYPRCRRAARRSRHQPSAGRPDAG